MARRKQVKSERVKPSPIKRTYPQHHKDYTSKQLEALKPNNLEMGKYNIKASGRFKTFAYRKNGVKYYGMKDKFTGTVYKRMNEDVWNSYLMLFGKVDVDKAVSKMWGFSKEGLVWQAENVRKGVITRIRYEFFPGETVTINGVEYNEEQIIEKLESLQNDERWVDWCDRNAKYIDEFWADYDSESDFMLDDEDYLDLDIRDEKLEDFLKKVGELLR